MLAIIQRAFDIYFTKNKKSEKEQIIENKKG